MLPMNGIIARIAFAILAGVVTFVVLLILAVLVGYVNVEIADIIRRFAPVLALLTGLYYAFVGYQYWPTNRG